MLKLSGSLHRGARLMAAAILVIAAACASDPGVEVEESAPPDGAEASAQPAPRFADDPLAGAPELFPALADPERGSEGIHYDDDPLAGAPMMAPENFTGSVGPMKELKTPPPDSEVNADLIELSSELSMTVLRARFLEEELARASSVFIPAGPFTFGDRVPVRFRLRNPLGELVELLPPQQGLALELTWEVERWLPIGGHDRVMRHRWFLLADFIRLESDETYETRTEIPLDLDGDDGALWRVRVDARIRCGGAMLGDRQLPVHRVDYRGGELFAFPAGWQELRADPLEGLRRALLAAESSGDRHVLVATALLRGEQRYRGLEMLLDCVERPVSPRRGLTAITALQWLTRLQIGENPQNWIRWREERKVAVSTR